jgi:AraC-like DNA-binding protein/ligand-binding sensor protein
MLQSAAARRTTPARQMATNLEEFTPIYVKPSASPSAKYHGMEQTAFDEWVGWPLVQRFEKSFSKATGVLVHIVPAGDPCEFSTCTQLRRILCPEADRAGAACCACSAAEQNAAPTGNQTVGLQELTCRAGLTHIRVPVLVGGRHVATLVTGLVFRRPHLRRDFRVALKKAKRGLRNDWKQKAWTAWSTTPVVPLDRIEAVTHLLNIFASCVGNDPGWQAIFAPDRKPGIVSRAKQFIHSHLHDKVTLKLVAQHVHVNRFYFCKIFKKTSGMTLSDYVARTRVDRVKALLADPSMRVSEAGYAAGFGSIPRFNSAFKHYVGMAPTEYRDMLRSPPRSFPNKTIANK